MTSFIKKYLQSNDENHQDEVLGTALNQMFDAQLRNEMAQEVGNKEHRNANKIPTLRRMLFRATAIAATIAILIIGYQQIAVQSDPIKIASRMLSQETIMHPGNIKGEGDISNTRLAAIKAFNEKEFSTALDHFGQIQNPSEQDRYFQGLAALRSNQYSLSINLLGPIAANTNSVLQGEASWYLALSNLLNNNFAKAEEILVGMDSESWKYDESRKLLTTLQKTKVNKIGSD